MTVSYAIGRNSTEGRAHTMCIEGTQGMESRGRAMGHLSPCGDPGWAGDLGWGGLGSQGWPSQPSQLAFLPAGCENPKPSLTELVVLELGLYAGDPVSKVLLQPLTGVSRGGQGSCPGPSLPGDGALPLAW